MINICFSGGVGTPSENPEKKGEEEEEKEGKQREEEEEREGRGGKGRGGGKGAAVAEQLEKKLELLHKLYDHKFANYKIS